MKMPLSRAEQIAQILPEVELGAEAEAERGEQVAIRLRCR